MEWRVINTPIQTGKVKHDLFIRKTLMIKLRSLIESFADDYQKNGWVGLPDSAVNKYADELADLINQAYAGKGGNFEIGSGNDLRNSDIKYWLATDIDSDPEADATVGGKPTKYGTKMTIMGQDGSPAAKKSAITKMVELMKKRGFYAEVDPDLAQKLNIQPIKDPEVIRQVLAGKELDFNADGSYQRAISAVGKIKTKVLIGIPKLI